LRRSGPRSDWSAFFPPFDAAIGRNVTDKLVVSFEAGVPIVDAYPVYKFKAELRLILKF
jgi:hypothetical protein